MIRHRSLVLVATGLMLLGCSANAADSAADPTPTPSVVAAPEPATTAPTPVPPPGAQPRLATDPAQVAADLLADSRALADPATAEPDRVAAARRQQVAYRAIARNPEWDSVVRPVMAAEFGTVYDRNIDARRQLTTLASPRDTLPAWRIQAPAPEAELLGYYREAEAASGVGWNYLAAINLIETHFGSVNGVSLAGAQGPMQFMPDTFAAYGSGDVHAPRDAIMAAGKYLAANGFANNPDSAIYHYNHADEYVRAVHDYAAILAADPTAFGTFYRWDVYYKTTAGDVLLPIGYFAAEPIAVADYLATHPQ